MEYKTSHAACLDIIAYAKAALKLIAPEKPAKGGLEKTSLKRLIFIAV